MGAVLLTKYHQKEKIFNMAMTKTQTTQKKIIQFHFDEVIVPRA